MGVVEQLLDWSKEFFLPLGETGLFIIAFVESSVFPVPPDVLLIPMSLVNPSSGLYYATVAAVGSVLGGIAGYFIGLKGGRPIALRLFSENRIRRVESYFDRYGAWAVLIAAFSPIPYKVFTIASGMVKLDIKRFVVASAIGRASRFFAEAIVIMIWGEQIIDLLVSEFEIITLVISAIIIGAVLLYTRIRARRSNPKP
jgi:undecaprenyl-diphosphatase